MSQQKISAGQRQQMIAEAAYFRAERRGFAGGDAVRDWCEAEAEIDAQSREAEDEQLVERVQEILETASRTLAALRRKATRLSKDARAEWQKDVDTLAVLRTTLRPQLAELRKQGEHASQQLREQASKIRGEIADVVQRLGGESRH